MGKIRLESGKPVFDLDQHDFSVFRETNDERVSAIIEKITQTDLLAENKCCFVYGMGGQPKSTYNELTGLSGCEVVFVQSLLPIAMRFLAPVLASYRGLVRMHSLEHLVDVFFRLISRSMAGVFVLNSAHESYFAECVKRNDGQNDFRFGAEIDPEHFVYIVDADVFDTKTGMIEAATFGPKFRNLWIE